MRYDTPSVLYPLGDIVRAGSTTQLYDVIAYTAIITLGLTAVVYYAVRRLNSFVREHGRRVIDGLFWLAARVATRTISARLSMRRYCRSQLANGATRYLQVPGHRGTSVDIDDVFVTLGLEGSDRETPYSSEDILQIGNRLIVVGDPGSGKTTLTKRLLRETCRQAQERPLRGLLPIRLELRDLLPHPSIDTNSQSKWLLDELRAKVGRVEGFQMARLFDSWSADAGLLVLLDGLDEVSIDRYPIVARALVNLSRRLAELSDKNVIIMTMRTQFYQQVGHEFVEDYQQTLYVRRFLPNEVYLFLKRWPFRQADREANVRRLYSDLMDRAALREICSNPLILAMYVQNDLESAQGSVPDTETQFYNAVLNELLVMRRRRQGQSSSRTDTLRQQREELLGLLALENLTDSSQPANSLSWKRAISAAQTLWKCEPSDAEARLYDISRETGIINHERTGESFHFIHLTFCEFLAAIECANGRRDGWQTLLASHRQFISAKEPHIQTRLVEVIPFAHALLPRVYRTEALREVAQLGDRILLAHCFLETQLYSEEEWPKYVLEEQGYLASEDVTEWDETRLRRLHLFSVMIRDARDWWRNFPGKQASPIELEDVFALIVGKNREMVTRIFASYASQDAAAALRLADEVGVDMQIEHPELLVRSCQEEPFLALVLDRAQKDSGSTWNDILLDAALIFANIAARLNALNVNPDLRNKVSGVPRLCGVRRNSWYEYLIQRNLADERSDAALHGASHMRMAMGQARANYFLHRFPYLIAVAAFSLLIVVSSPFLPTRPEFNFESIAEFVWAFLVSWNAFIQFLSYNVYIGNLYRAVFNLRPDKMDEFPFELLARRGGLLARTTLKRQRLALAALLRARDDTLPRKELRRLLPISTDPWWR